MFPLPYMCDVLVVVSLFYVLTVMEYTTHFPAALVPLHIMSCILLFVAFLLNRSQKNTMISKKKR